MNTSDEKLFGLFKCPLDNDTEVLFASFSLDSLKEKMMAESKKRIKELKHLYNGNDDDFEIEYNDSSISIKFDGERDNLYYIEEIPFIVKPQI